MKQQEAKTLILEEWDRWVAKQAVDPGGPTGKDLLKFFFELEDGKSPLLDFQSRGHDKWRIIHAWLLSAERVGDAWCPRRASCRRASRGWCATNSAPRSDDSDLRFRLR